MSVGDTLFEGRWEAAVSKGEDELDGKTLADLFEGRVGVVSFDPADLSERAEEYLAKGFVYTAQNLDCITSLPTHSPKKGGGTV